MLGFFVCSFSSIIVNNKNRELRTYKGQSFMKKISIGILAHVDAGKTTLSEALLYSGGTIRKVGRVDNKDSFLDNFYLERERGITIFSKQARIRLDDVDITLIDTPGHFDFSAETERTLGILDYIILVINGMSGIQSHTKTLWKLAKEYSLPVFIFINKTDNEQVDKELVFKQLKTKLDDNIIEFDDFLDESFSKADKEQFYEELSLADEGLMEKFLSGIYPDTYDISLAIKNRMIFPCISGSALRFLGIDNLIKLLSVYTLEPDYSEELSAIVYKISTDEAGNRLSHLKLKGGSIHNKMLINGEKINQIRVYNGNKFEAVDSAYSGDVCTVLGLEKTYALQILGESTNTEKKSFIEPVLSYDIVLPADTDAVFAFPKLRAVLEEYPEINISWNEDKRIINVKLMGAIQLEILKNIVKERLGINIDFSSGSIVYKESIKSIVEGVGHYEPLRHYSEVHILLEPLDRGKGIEVVSELSEDELNKSWQKSILTHIKEKNHRGVLTGSQITDIRLKLVAGKANIKHTDGGDFREATYRAIRQGLMQAESILLEPYYNFIIELPSVNLGRAISDLSNMHAEFEFSQAPEGIAILEGRAPVVCIQNYQSELNKYTAGEGKIYNSFGGYDICHNEKDIIEEIGYNAELDSDNPSSSIFCANGKGFYVPWYEVAEHMHIDSGLGYINIERDNLSYSDSIDVYKRNEATSMELMEIFERTYGKIKHRIGDYYNSSKKSIVYDKPYKIKEENLRPKKEYLLVDGYNVIFSSEKLSDLAKLNIDAARYSLIDLLTDFKSMSNYNIILVFDAYRVLGHKTEIFEYNGIYVVYTKEAETADHYIEKTTHEMSKKYIVTVATSDRVEQIIIRSQGALLMSSRELLENIDKARKNLRKEYLENKIKEKNYLFDNLPEDLKEKFEDIRLGRIIP